MTVQKATEWTPCPPRLLQDTFLAKKQANGPHLVKDVLPLALAAALLILVGWQAGGRVPALLQQTQFTQRLAYSCTDIHQFARAYVDGVLQESQVKSFLTHLSGCEHCRQYVATLVKTNPQLPE